MTRTSRNLALSALAVLCVATLAALSVRHVPAGHLGFQRDRLLPAGWHVVLPWSGVRDVAARGRMDLSPLEMRTPEGAAFRYQVELDYTLGPDLAPGLIAAVHDQGIAGALRGLAQGKLDELGGAGRAEELLSNLRGLEAEIRGAIETAGAGVARIDLRSELADRLTSRRELERALALTRPRQGKLLLIGLDAADWETINPLIEAGQLPNLARLVREGAHGDLRSIDPMFSPMLWTTVATGKPPDQHGIADFLVRDPATGARHPITSDYRKVKALWNILSDLNVRSGWISWWASYPAEPVLGTMVSELLPHTMVHGGVDAAVTTPGITSPPDYLASRRDLLVPPARVSFEQVRGLFPLTRAEFDDAQRRLPLEVPDDESKEPPDPVVFSIKLLSATLTYHRVALDMLRGDASMVAVFYEGIDMVGHRFQHYMPPKMDMVSEEDYRRFRDTVPAFHRLQDEMIGELLDAAGPGTTTLILSDHGFRSGPRRPQDLAPYTQGQPAEWHRPWGILLLHGPEIRAGRLPRTSLYDVTPTLLYLAGLPLADDMPGRLIEEAFRDGWLRAAEPRRLATYESVGAPLTPVAREAVDHDAMNEMMANLRALGYVAGPAGGGGAAAEAGGQADDGDTTQVYYHRNLATFHINQGHLAEAERELLLANERKPLPKTYALLSRVRAEQGRYREAAAAIEDGLRELPEQMDPDSLLWLVEMYLKAGDPRGGREALARWDEWVTPPVRAAAEGRFAEAAGDLSGARRFYEEALEGNPLMTHIALRLFALYERDHAAERIVPFLERGVRQTAEGVDIYHNLLGELARSRGDLQAAERHFARAVDLDPENGVYLGNLAVAQAALGRSAEARETIGWAVRWKPRQPQAWLAIGSAWDRLGEPDRAVEAFDAAGECGAGEIQVVLAKALVLGRAGRTGEASRLVASALERHPGAPQLLDLARRLGTTP